MLPLAVAKGRAYVLKAQLCIQKKRVKSVLLLSKIMDDLNRLKVSLNTNIYLQKSHKRIFTTYTYQRVSLCSSTNCSFFLFCARSRKDIWNLVGKNHQTEFKLLFRRACCLPVLCRTFSTSSASCPTRSRNRR